MSPDAAKQNKGSGEEAKLPLRNIILDTNVFDLLSNKELEPKFIALLREAVGLGYGIVICDIVLFELLQEASMDKELWIMQQLSDVPSLPLTQEVMFAAAHVASLYKEEGLELKQFAIGDRIIAGTSVMNNALILTKNGRDFPEPFFKELDRRHVDYENGSVQACVYLYFKEPQLDVITKHHSMRTASIQKKAKTPKQKP